MTPPPFGTFPKIHPFWKGKASLRLILFKFSDKEAVLTLDAPLLYFLVELLHYSALARTPGSTLRSFCLADSDAVVGKTDLHNALGLQ